MKHLILLRGLPGIGKSTWVREQGLDGYVLSMDTLRLCFASVQYCPHTGYLGIPQRNNAKIAQLTQQLLEARMAFGECIVMDEQNIDIQKYVTLANKYDYKVHVIMFPLDKDLAHKRNRERMPEWKRVPDFVIDNSYTKFMDSSDTFRACVQANKNVCTYLPYQFPLAVKRELNIDLTAEVLDLDKIKHIVAFGDLHGCAEPLKKYLEEHPIQQDTLYVFVGDYLDRGVQNAEIIEIMYDLTQKHDNIICLEGNHNYEKLYAYNRTQDIQSDEFVLNTLPQLLSVDKEKIRLFVQSWRKHAIYKAGTTYLIFTHAGLNHVPYDIFTLAEHDLLKGDSYREDVDKEFDSQCIPGIHYQIHGHRNSYKKPIHAATHSFNLCSSVEFGEPLRILHLHLQQTGLTFDTYEYDNPITSGKPNWWASDAVREELTQDQKQLIALRKNPYIHERVCIPGKVHSFNFTREAFYTGHWDEQTMTARGLYLHPTTGKIIARGYDKFFHLDENISGVDTSLQSITYPARRVEKVNGFLGLLSSLDGDPFIATKSTIYGYHTELFHNVLMAHVPKDVLDKWVTICHKNNCTMLFEVVDPQHDPHIVEYDKTQLVLLDIVTNTWDPEFESDLFATDILKGTTARFPVHSNEVIPNAKVMQRLIQELQENRSIEIEGFVVTGANNKKLKVKTPFYNRWKTARRFVDRLKHGYPVTLSHTIDPVIRSFVQWIQTTSPDLDKSIPELRQQYMKTKGE